MRRHGTRVSGETFGDAALDQGACAREELHELAVHSQAEDLALRFALKLVQHLELPVSISGEDQKGPAGGKMRAGQA